MSDEKLTPEMETAADLIIHINDLEGIIFPNKPAEVILDHPEFQAGGAGNQALVFARGFKKDEKTGATDLSYCHHINSRRVLALLADARENSMNLVGGQIVPTNYNEDERIFALAAGQVRRHCQHEFGGITILKPDNINLVPKLQPRANYLLSRTSFGELNSPSFNQFDAIMIEEAVLMFVSLTDEYLDDISAEAAQIVSVRSPEELRKLMDSFGL